jgi:hypothetical protein
MCDDLGSVWCMMSKVPVYVQIRISVCVHAHMCVCVCVCVCMHANNMNIWISSEKYIFHLEFHEKSVCSTFTCYWGHAYAICG